MKELVLALEICFFWSSLILAIFWFKYPQNIYFPIILTIIAILTAGFEIFRRNYNFKVTEKHSNLIISEGNTLFVNYTENSYSEKSKVGLVLYSMQLTNTSQNGFKIKQMYLEYKIKGKVIQADLKSIPADYEKSPLYKDKISYVKILCKNPDRYIVLQGWENFSSQNSKYLAKGDVLSFSSFFLFKLKSYNELQNIENLKLIINDYSGNKVDHQVEIQQKWIQDGQNSYLNYNDNLPEDYKKQNNINPF